MQLQDITFTVDLSTMSPKRYKEIIAFVKREGTGDIETFTYAPEDNMKEVDNPLFLPDKA